MPTDRAGSCRFPRLLFPMALGVALACFPLLAAPGTSVLPSDVRDVIRERFLSPERETRYLDGAIDLDGDGQAEVVVYVAGGNACEDEGCPTLVFTHLASGYRLHSTIAGTRPPIGVSMDLSNGWRNLIVRIADPEADMRDLEIKFDGRTYPASPTVPKGRVKTPRAPDRVLINDLPFERMKLF